MLERLLNQFQSTMTRLMNNKADMVDHAAMATTKTINPAVMIGMLVWWPPHATRAIATMAKVTAPIMQLLMTCCGTGIRMGRLVSSPRA